MMTNTYVPLATITLSSATTSLTFSSLPASYRDIILVFNGSKTGSTDTHLQVRANGDSGKNYPRVAMGGSSGGSYSNSSTNIDGMQMAYVGAGQPRVTSILQIFDYSATDKHKTFLAREAEAAESTDAVAGRWSNTAAITSLTILWSQNADNMSAGTTISLYGVAA